MSYTLTPNLPNNTPNDGTQHNWYNLQIELQHSIDRAADILKDANANNHTQVSICNEDTIDDQTDKTSIEDCNRINGLIKDYIESFRDDMRNTADEFINSVIIYERFIKRRSELVGLSDKINKYAMDSTMQSAKDLQTALENHILNVLNDEDFIKVCNRIKYLYTKIINMQTTSRLIASTQPTPTCSVCLSRTVCVISTNCGHGGCEECFMQMGNCPVCRSSITDRCKLYI